MAREFKEMYPKGLNRSICLFEKSIKYIIETGEIGSIIRNAEDIEERKWLVEFKQHCEFLKGKPFWEWHWMSLLHDIESPNLLKDIIAMMAYFDCEKITEADDV